MHPWAVYVRVKLEDPGEVLRVLLLIATLPYRHRILTLYLETEQINDQIIETIATGLPSLSRL